MFNKFWVQFLRNLTILSFFIFLTCQFIFSNLPSWESFETKYQCQVWYAQLSNTVSGSRKFWQLFNGFLRSSKSILVRAHQMIALKYRHICITIRFATKQVENIFVLRKFKWKYIICDNISILKSIEVSTICVLKIGCNFFSWWTSQEVKKNVIFIMCSIEQRNLSKLLMASIPRLLAITLLPKFPYCAVSHSMWLYHISLFLFLRVWIGNLEILRHLQMLWGALWSFFKF